MMIWWIKAPSYPGSAKIVLFKRWCWSFDELGEACPEVVDEFRSKILCESSQLVGGLGLLDELCVVTICHACPFHLRTLVATPRRSMTSSDFRTMRYM